MTAIFAWLDSLSGNQWTAIAAIAAAISAIVATVTAVVSLAAVKQSNKAHEAEVAHSFFVEYGSIQMLEDLMRLSKVWDDENKKFVERDFVEKFKEKRATDPVFIEIDKARRRVKTHYLKAVWLHRRKLISEALFLTVIDSRGIILLHNVVAPLTIATDKPTNPEIGDFKYLEKYRDKLRWQTEYNV